MRSALTVAEKADLDDWYANKIEEDRDWNDSFKVDLQRLHETSQELKQLRLQMGAGVCSFVMVGALTGYGSSRLRSNPSLGLIIASSLSGMIAFACLAYSVYVYHYVTPQKKDDIKYRLLSSSKQQEILRASRRQSRATEQRQSRRQSSLEQYGYAEYNV